MIHFDFTVSRIDAELIFNGIQLLISNSLESMLSLKSDDPKYHWHLQHITHLRSIKERMSYKIEYTNQQ